MVISPLHFIIIACINLYYAILKKKKKATVEPYILLAGGCEGCNLVQKKALNNLLRPSEDHGNNTFISYPHCLCRSSNILRNI